MLNILNSKYTIAIISILLIIGAYMLGANHGINKERVKYQQQIIELQSQNAAKIKYWQQVSESKTIEYQNQKDKDSTLYQGLKNENQSLKDNLNNCILSDKRLRSVQNAAKVRISVPATTVKAESIRESTNILSMSCAGLQQSYIACAEAYSNCRNGYNSLWQWATDVSK